MRESEGARLGLEMEMVVVRRGSGASHAAERYPETLARLKRARGEDIHLTLHGGRAIGVTGPLGESGFDNGYNLLETAFAPVAGGPGGLDRLAAAVRTELADVRDALAEEDAAVLNAAEHPAATLDMHDYLRIRVPRAIYAELVGHRGWLHRAGIDAKAQNGPCTAVPIEEAARALNVMLALAPAFIALFANSPLQDGRVTGLKENRLMLWDRMFRHARFAGDHRLQQLPERPFADLGEYFRWMFAPDTVSRGLPLAEDGEYKSVVSVYLDGHPSLGRFLQAPSWTGRRADNGRPVTLRPHSGHFEYSQFAHFLDARFRYRLAGRPPLEELLAAWRKPGGIEDLYTRVGVAGYIEGRAPGAVFPDRQLVEEAGADVAARAPMAASALQLGILRNLEAAEVLVGDWGWPALRGMRAMAIRAALADDRVRALAADVLAVAAQGLPDADRHWTMYADYVLASGRTGADRLLALWTGTPGGVAEKLRAVYARRALWLGDE
ncbi:glutamate--cysteine ligase [Bordetella sputigena]|uniref:glutamate-cysteine ligase family protein n=1 Tax=Bordetella sputigena TaxID=1416810 RepID=UPI0039F01D54